MFNTTELGSHLELQTSLGNENIIGVFLSRIVAPFNNSLSFQTGHSHKVPLWRL